MPELAAAAALAAAFAMGVAIRRGGTCMVVAVDELVRLRRGWKLLALAECGVLAAVLMALAARAGWQFMPTADYPAGAPMVAGAVLLGLGAWLNGACLMGTVARIGGREWAWLMTPAGFYLGCYAAARARLHAGAGMAAPMGITFAMLGGFALVLLAGMARRNQPWRDLGNAPSDLRFTRALLAIGALSVVLTALAGPWAWSDTVARLARGQMAAHALALALFAALLAGSLLGGRNRPGGSWDPRRALACLAGGAMMGVGAALVPGGNDALVLNGVPGFHLYAILAVTIMAATIAGAMAARGWAANRGG